MSNSSPNVSQSMIAFGLSFLITALAGMGMAIEHDSRRPGLPQAVTGPASPFHKPGYSQIAGQLRDEDPEESANENFDLGADMEQLKMPLAATRPAQSLNVERQDLPASRSESAGHAGDYRNLEGEPAPMEEAARKSREERYSSLDDLAGLETREAQPRVASHFDYFYPRSGYWANMHIPGDPAIRLLHARLAKWDRGGLLSSGEPLLLEQAVLAVDQPFDPPKDHALALSLFADRPLSADENELQRVTVQVGIRAVDHRRGERPAMSLAAILDVPQDAPDQRWIEARALVDALISARRPGDRFALLMTHTRNGLVISPEEFRYGTVQQLRKRLLEDNVAENGRPLSLIGALTLTRKMLADGSAGTDREKPLGTRSALLISASNPPGIEELAEVVHRNALDGVHLSAVPLGDRVEMENVDRLVLAGLGHRRILESPARARALIENELYAASRAVARASRLSIKLAPGVQLLGIPGSHPLDETQAQRTRDIEKAFDLKLTRELGIRSDRGKDEDGIQIVIPTIDSGDELVILLELAVAEPGPLAEVSLKYKDIVFIRNAELHASLGLDESGSGAGPVALLVRKNRLARDLAMTLAAASRSLANGNKEQARHLLAAARESLLAARAATPAWGRDPELLNDERVLQQYLDVLASTQTHPVDPDQLAMLSDSLRFASWAKTHLSPASASQFN